MNQEIFIPLKINTRKGRAAVVVKPDDYFANTPLARLLARAELLESQLIKSVERGFTLKEFCEINKISPRYVRSIIAVNCLSPRMKKTIVDGDVPKHVSVERLRKPGISMAWMEQEKQFFTRNNI